MFFHLNLICVPLTCGFQYLEGRTVTFICFVFDDKLPREVMRHSKAPLSFFKGVHTNKQYCPPRSIFQHLPRYENNLAYLWMSVSRGTDGNIHFVFDNTLLREEMRHSDEWKRASFSVQKKERINSCC